MTQILVDTFFNLLAITGILLLFTFIIAIITAPFQKNEKEKKIEEAQEVFYEAINKIVDEALEELKTEKENTNEEEKKDEE